MFVVFLSVLLLPCAFAQIIVDGSCSDYTDKTKENFNVLGYLGLWYELQRYENVFQTNGDCTTGLYGANPNGTMSVLNKMRNLATDVESVIEGYAWEPIPARGRFFFKFPYSPPTKYWVIDTDYDKFAVVWSCSDAKGKSIQFLWILGRQLELDENSQKRVDRIIAECKFDPTKLRTTNNKDAKCRFSNQINLV